MKLSNIKGEKAIEVLADIIDPITKIACDKEVRAEYGSNRPKLFLVKLIIKKYANEIIEIMALLNMKDVNEYKENLNLITLTSELLDLMNDPDISAIFQSQGQTEETSFGSATENTEAPEE